MDQQTALDDLGTDTRADVAEALWLKEFDAAQLAPDILEKLASEKNSRKAFAERMQARLRDLIANPPSFTPSCWATFLFTSTQVVQSTLVTVSGVCCNHGNEAPAGPPSAGATNGCRKYG